MRAVQWAVGLAMASLVVGAAAAQGHADHHDHGVQADAPLAQHVRAANGRFATFDAKALQAEGYGPIPCTSSIDGGAMGIHWVNPKYLGEDAPRLDHPQAVMYEPDAQGRMHLTGVEYISLKGPAVSLEGQLFAFQGSPNRYGLPAFYELHVWAWKPNPKGVFTDFNPNVSCANAR
jgi:hypothetical protein